LKKFDHRQETVLAFALKLKGEFLMGLLDQLKRVVMLAKSKRRFKFTVTFVRFFEPGSKNVTEHVQTSTVDRKIA